MSPRVSRHATQRRLQIPYDVTHDQNLQLYASECRNLYETSFQQEGTCYSISNSGTGGETGDNEMKQDSIVDQRGLQDSDCNKCMQNCIFFHQDLQYPDRDPNVYSYNDSLHVLQDLQNRQDLSMHICDHMDIENDKQDVVNLQDQYLISETHDEEEVGMVQFEFMDEAEQVFPMVNAPYYDEYEDMPGLISASESDDQDETVVSQSDETEESSSTGDTWIDYDTSGIATSDDERI